MREALFKPGARDSVAIRSKSGRDAIPLLARAVLAGVALLALSGCKTMSVDDITGSIAAPAKPASSSPADLRAYSEQLRRLYEAHPGNRKIAMAYAKSLRARGLNDQAAAVMENIAIKYPKDREVLGAFGKALADAGQLRRAQEVLSHADSPDDPNWSVVNTRGSIADQLGDHKEAQDDYETALKLAPGQPSVLSNLGLSYALSHDLPRAESVLREAAASPNADMRERQNLALVLALQGKFAEAEQVSERDLSPQQARDNVASIRQMIAQSNDWRDIQTSAAPRGRTTAVARSWTLPATGGRAQAASDSDDSAASRKMQQLSADAAAR
ncbi:tetratricopeptide repeat protein [Rhodoblastus sp.]|uniref:tetratricopeptide repeat protein n=1 Tax=Rhodoblastus sp. TaxID=1962975 RepID=UPI003F9D5BA7